MSAFTRDSLVADESRIAINIDLEIRRFVDRLYVGIIGIFLGRGDSVGFWSVVEVPKQDYHGSRAVIKILLENIGHFGAVEAGYSRELLLNVNQLLLIGIAGLLGDGYAA